LCILALGSTLTGCGPEETVPSIDNTDTTPQRSKMDLLCREWVQVKLWENETEKALSDDPLKYQFRADGTYGQGRKSDTEYKLNGVWVFSKDSSQIRLNEGMPFEQQFWVNKLDEESFQYEFYNASSGINYTSHMELVN